MVRTKPVRELLSRLAVPLALLVGSAVLHLMTVQSRRWMEPEFARSGRYLHIGAALTLPMLAIAADAIARRWRVLTPALVALFVVAIPWNLGDFEHGRVRFPVHGTPQGGPHQHRASARGAPWSPAMCARSLTRAQTMPTSGSCWTALDAGKLEVPAEPLSTEFTNELRLQAGRGTESSARCRPRFGSSCLDLRGGTRQPPEDARCQRFRGSSRHQHRGRYRMVDRPSRVAVTTREGSRNTSRACDVQPLQRSVAHL